VQVSFNEDMYVDTNLAGDIRRIEEDIYETEFGLSINIRPFSPMQPARPPDIFRWKLKVLLGRPNKSTSTMTIENLYFTIHHNSKSKCKRNDHIVWNVYYTLVNLITTQYT
jgi:hypothetical protein